LKRQAAQRPGLAPGRVLVQATAMTDAVANLARIRQSIARAEADFGRPPGSAALIAVSKTFPSEAILPVLEAGQRLFGENYVQEAKGKWPGLRERFPDARVHMIGPLQSNKAGEAVRLFDAIQSLDRDSLAKELAKAVQKEGRQPDLFVQVNTGSEPQKGGVLPTEAEAFVTRCRDVHGLSIAGLMCIPPADAPPSPHFALLAKLARNLGLPLLSMGMSADFEAAIQMGATHVRVGSAIFGVR
jgi:PLP dependent protein